MSQDDLILNSKFDRAESNLARFDRNQTYLF